MTEQRPIERTTLAVTNLIKLGGLALGLHEGFGQVRPQVLILAAFMLAGANQLESFFKGFFGAK